MDRGVLPAADAVAGALLFVVADDGADGGERIVLKEHLARLHEAVLLEELDHGGDGCVDGTSLLTHGVFAVEAAVCLRNDMQRHGLASL